MKIRFLSPCKLACAVLASLAPAPASAQLWTWTRDQMVEYTKAWTGDRFPDGRPKVPDDILARMKNVSIDDLVNLRIHGIVN